MPTITTKFLKNGKLSMQINNDKPTIFPSYFNEKSIEMISKYAFFREVFACAKNISKNAIENNINEYVEKQLQFKNINKIDVSDFYKFIHSVIIDFSHSQKTIKVRKKYSNATFTIAKELFDNFNDKKIKNLI